MEAVSMTEQLTEALVDVRPHLTPRDAAAVELAAAYASALDAEPEAIGRLGPQLHAVLESLLMTPRARAQATKKGGGLDGPGKSRLDELRERRHARQHGAEAVDAAAP